MTPQGVGPFVHQGGRVRSVLSYPCCWKPAAIHFRGVLAFLALISLSLASVLSVSLHALSSQS